MKSDHAFLKTACDTEIGDAAKSRPIHRSFNTRICGRLEKKAFIVLKASFPNVSMFKLTQRLRAKAFDALQPPTSGFWKDVRIFPFACSTEIQAFLSDLITVFSCHTLVELYLQKLYICTALLISPVFNERHNLSLHHSSQINDNSVLFLYDNKIRYDSPKWSQGNVYAQLCSDSFPNEQTSNAGINNTEDTKSQCVFNNINMCKLRFPTKSLVY